MLAIGEVAKRTGLKVPTIRFYEQEGLLAAPQRAENGRRLFSAGDVNRLAFIRRARDLGFQLDDIRSLLALADAPEKPCEEAERIAQAHLVATRARIAQLRRLERELSSMSAACDGAASRTCRIIEALADGGSHAADARR